MGLSSSSQNQGVTMDPQLEETINKLITDNAVMIFSKQYCPYCKTAKDCFNNIGAEYKVMDINSHQNTGAIQEILQKITGARTVPRVFIGGKCIGGGSETKELMKSGELEKLVDACK